MALQHPDRVRKTQEPPVQTPRVTEPVHDPLERARTALNTTNLLEDKQAQHDAVSTPVQQPLEPDSRLAASYPQEPAVCSDASKSVKENNNLKGNNPNAIFVKMESTWVPKELSWLVTEQDLRPSAIPWLMNQAGAAQQRLSDVVLATSKRLKALNLRGRELAAYLKKVIRSGQDFSITAKGLRQYHQHEITQEALKNKALDLVGRQFVKADGTARFVVEEAGFITELRDGMRRVMRFTQGFLDAIDSRRLMPARP
jgi:hypothetical protein